MVRSFGKVWLLVIEESTPLQWYFPGGNNNDDIYRKIADEVFKNKGYAAEHPLTRNW
jgi:hypothetical protein